MSASGRWSSYLFLALTVIYLLVALIGLCWPDVLVFDARSYNEQLSEMHGKLAGLRLDVGAGDARRVLD